MVSIIASVLTLCAISYDRYLGIIHPFKSFEPNNKSCCIIIAFIWIFSIAISIPTYVYRTYREQTWSDYTKKSCDDFGWPYALTTDSDGCVVKVWHEKRIYYTTVILLLFFLPIFIMSITYSIIIRKLWKRQVIGETAQVNEVITKKRRQVGNLHIFKDIFLHEIVKKRIWIINKKYIVINRVLNHTIL